MKTSAKHPVANAGAEAVLRHLARKAIGMTGADIEHVIRTARQKARRERRGVTFADIEAILTTAKIERTNYTRIRMAIHEAAHAVARIRLELGEISMITIDAPEGGFVSGSSAAGQEETEELLTAMLVATLAGRAAEQEVFKLVTTSSAGPEKSDLALATQLAFDMETKLGFGQESPLLYRSSDDMSAILHLNRELAARVNARLENAYGIARKLVVDRMEAIEFVAGGLMTFETLEGPELEKVITHVRKLVADPPQP
jgi:cell division protease FtsH